MCSQDAGNQRGIHLRVRVAEKDHIGIPRITAREGERTATRCPKGEVIANRTPEVGASAYGISSSVPWEFMEDHRQHGFQPMHLGADIRFARDMMLNVMAPASAQFHAVDAMPRFEQAFTRQRLEDYAHFAPSPLARTNPIVVPEENVQELMDRILKLQQPDRTDRIRQALRNPEGYMIDNLPKQKFHAQIISFAA